MIEQLPLTDAYPNARNAVAAFETIPKNEAHWAEIRRRKLSLGYVVGRLASIIASNGEAWADELKTDDFRKFVAAKLGMF